MADSLTPAISDRICKHMNEDHAEAIALYAKVYGNQPETEAAQMLSIDAEGMDLSIQIQEKNDTLRIEFDHTLTDSEDAHQTLIAMVRQARINQVS
jgi:putative heme iron utilization protein